MTKPGKTGLPRLIAAAGYSLSGLKAAWRHEEAFRLEATLALIFVPLSFVITDQLSHQLLLLMSCALVVVVELINSAIEAVVDRISPEVHPLSGQAKDIGSAAVFVSMMFFLLAWGLSLWQFFRQASP
jgi:diacylglycerol kinase (ATP)